MTAVTTTASGIAFGAYDVVIAGGVEHMGRHPMGEGVDPNPRFLVREARRPRRPRRWATTAENLHDRFPPITKERADAYAVARQEKTATAYADGKIQPDLVPVATRSAEAGWGLATHRRADAPGHHDGGPRRAQDAVRPHGRVTAGNAAGINDGATAAPARAEEAAASSGCR